MLSGGHVLNKYFMAPKMTLEFVKPRFGRLTNPHINTSPSLEFNFLDKKIQESGINILHEAECEIYKISQTRGDINMFFLFKNSSPFSGDWMEPPSLGIYICMAAKTCNFWCTQGIYMSLLRFLDVLYDSRALTKVNTKRRSSMPNASWVQLRH